MFFYRALCLTVMRPGCHNGSLFQKVLCKEACELIKDDICKIEWSEIINRIEDGYLNIDNIFPDCSKFPSVKSLAGTTSCFYPQALQREYQSIFALSLVQKYSQHNVNGARVFQCRVLILKGDA